MTPFQAAVFAYVDNGVASEKKTIDSLQKWSRLNNKLVVYRGQAKSSSSPHKWPPLFSTTTDESVAKRFAERVGPEGGCVWKITLEPETRIINVAEVLEGNYPNKYKWESEILVESGGIMTGKKQIYNDGTCYVIATYKPRRKVQVFDIRGQQVPESDDDITEEYFDPEEVDGGKRRKTRRKFKMPRLMSRKYCKKTPCRKMGFTQKASCRPYKNCFTARAKRRSSRKQ